MKIYILRKGNDEYIEIEEPVALAIWYTRQVPKLIIQWKMDF
jgi:hypothetical protein